MSTKAHQSHNKHTVICCARIKLSMEGNDSSQDVRSQQQEFLAILYDQSSDFLLWRMSHGNRDTRCLRSLHFFHVESVIYN